MLRIRSVLRQRQIHMAISLCLPGNERLNIPVRMITLGARCRLHPRCASHPLLDRSQVEMGPRSSSNDGSCSCSFLGQKDRHNGDEIHIPDLVNARSPVERNTYATLNISIQVAACQKVASLRFNFFESAGLSGFNILAATTNHIP